MNVRPISIIVLSIIYFISPAAIIIQGAVMNLVPLIGQGNIFFRLSLSDILVLFLYPVCAVSIFSVRKWGWWLFIISSFLLIGRNLAVYFINPFTGIPILIFYNIIIAATAGFFFRKHLIAPYFNQRLRIWEQEERYEIDIFIEIDELNLTAELADISLSGCFIRTSTELAVKQKYRINIVCQNIKISITAKVMRIARAREEITGYGLMFSTLKATEKTGLIELLSLFQSVGFTIKEPVKTSEDHRKDSRFRSDIGAVLMIPEKEAPLAIENISLSGCCVRTDENLDQGSVYTFSCGPAEHVFSCDAEVVWIITVKTGFRCGLLFKKKNSDQKKRLKQILILIKRMRGQKRVWKRSVLDKIVEETLPETPYRIITRIKKMATGRK